MLYIDYGKKNLKNRYRDDKIILASPSKIMG